MDARREPDPEALLAHAAWMRALAINLLGDPAAADDVVQDASIAVLRKPPAEGVALQPWLSRVVRHFAWRRRRGEARRQDHESRAALPEAAPSPADTLERLDLQQTMVDAVRALDEPLRTTIVLRYFEGRSSAEIAQLQRVPPGTVRWRLKRGLDELRGRLDRRFGSRSGWTAALAPFALRDASAPASTAAANGSVGSWKGVLAVSGAQFSLAAAAATVLIGALWWGLAGREPQSTASAASAPSAELAPPRDEPASAPQAQREIAASAQAPSSSSTPAASESSPPAHAAAEPPRIARLDARFIDAHGAPWAGVELTARANALEDDGPGHRASSGADGRVELELPLDPKWFAFRDTPKWRYDLVAARAGCATVKLQTTVSADATAHLGDVVLAAGVRVLGRVVDEAGNRFAGAEVGVVRGDFGDEDEGRMHRKGHKAFDPATSVRATADGEFVLDGVPAGAQRLWIHAEGMRYSWSAPLEVPSERDLTDVELVIAPLRVTDRIEGRVVDPQGAVVQHADVTFLGRSTRKGNFMTWIPVDAAGRFQLIVDYDDAAYDFTASEGTDTWSATTTKDVQPGTLDLVLQLHEKRALTVRVRDAAGAPIEGARFELAHRLSGGWAKTERKSEGLYEALVPDDEFRLTVRARGFRSVTSALWTPATMPQPYEVTLQRAPAVRGRVMAEGRAVAGATIELLAHDDDASGTVDGFRCVYMKGMDRDAARTDDAGRFDVGCDRDGAFWIRASSDGWTSAEVGPLEPSQLRDDAPFEIELTRGGAIEGRVLLPDGRDAEGAIVALNHGDGEPRTLRAGKNGVFRAEGLMPGKWQVTPRDEEIDPGSTHYASSKDRGPIPWSCEVVAGKTTRFDLDLTSK
jgi:RNA polymerase sigma-70 factor (ECF subfamily)